jgi:hypothetical protein
MNITKFFKQFNLETHCNHAENVAVLELLTLLYLVDNKITLTEQTFIDQWVATQITAENIDPKAVQTAAIATCRAALSNNQANLDVFLKDIAQRLNSNRKNSLDTAKKLANIDGEYSASENKLLTRFCTIIEEQMTA